MPGAVRCRRNGSGGAEAVRGDAIRISAILSANFSSSVGSLLNRLRYIASNPWRFQDTLAVDPARANRRHFDRLSFRRCQPFFSFPRRLRASWRASDRLLCTAWWARVPRARM
jgi:hypothetical protein